VPGGAAENAQFLAKDKNMSWSKVSAADVQPQAWKNKGGTTRELLAWPHAHDWALRISVACVERDGPFSAFPGVHRWLAVIGGAGLRLFDWPQSLGDEPLRFDGGLAPDAELIKGETDVFNVMERRGNLEVEAASHVLLPRTPWVPGARRRPRRAASSPAPTPPAATPGG
jgi:environmental stress-induced protein Ves